MPAHRDSAFEGLMDHRFGHAALQRLHELLGDYRAAEKVSLSLCASFFLQETQLFLGLLALRYDAMLQVGGRLRATPRVPWVRSIPTSAMGTDFNG
jgi:hypothetical protein